MSTLNQWTPYGVENFAVCDSLVVDVSTHWVWRVNILMSFMESQEIIFLGKNFAENKIIALKLYCKNICFLNQRLFSKSMCLTYEKFSPILIIATFLNVSSSPLGSVFVLLIFSHSLY
jgi:hypothetical protein